MAFEKISLETWLKFNTLNYEGTEYLPRTDELNYKHIAKPERSTSKSAGYDFKLPFDIDVPENQTIVLPSGIKANLDDLVKPEKNNAVRVELNSRVFLALYPRSSLGFNYRFTMPNTIPIIDADYYNNSDNEGHILIAFRVGKRLALPAGSKFCQGIIQRYFIMEDDNAKGVRTGGIGSTGK
jgi:dUTP pyrophosphatase